MCWSPTADLVAGIVVGGIGVVGLSYARDRRDVPLATLPILLGAHQLIESYVWHKSAGEGSVLTGAAVTLWTMIAFAILPLAFPIALLYAERERRPIQYVAAAFGLPVAVIMVYAVSSGAHATDGGHVLNYGADVPFLPFVLAGYLIAACVPFLTSPERTMRELGIALAVGAAIAAAINLLAFASIWCGFAAVVSVLVVRRTRHAAQHLCPALV